MKYWRSISALFILLAFSCGNLFSSIVESPAKVAANPIAAPGKIQVLLMVGDVKLIDPSGKSTAVQKGQVFTQGYTIAAGPGSGATLVFSNGATLRVKENGQLKIVKFVQAPFDETKEGTFMRLSRDPSHSEVELYLDNGTLQGEVKQLNKEANSSFVVVTPAGSVGPIGDRTGVISISVERDANGNMTGLTAHSSGTNNFTPTPRTESAPVNGASSSNTSNQNGTIQVSVTTDTDGKPVAHIAGATANSPESQKAVDDLFKAINDIRAKDNLAPVAAATVSPSSSAP